jgi:hypothetical protein
MCGHLEDASLPLRGIELKTSSHYIAELYARFLVSIPVNPLTPELNPSAQRFLQRFFTGISIFKWLNARRLYTSFGVEGLSRW